MDPLNPKKLLCTKWTALHPANKNRHFLVVKAIAPEMPHPKTEWVGIKAVFSQERQTLAWRAPQDGTVWAQGWVQDRCRRQPLW